MINAVIELGERRVHEVMVPRIAMVALPADRDLRGGDRHRHRGGPLPHPGLRGLDRRDRRHPLRQGPAAVPEGLGRRAAAAALAAADAGVRARVDDRRRPAARAPAAQGPHRDRARRVRRHGRPRDDRGPPRGDRRRDPGRVRRRGADDRPALRRRGAGRRAGRRRRPASCSNVSSGSRTRTSTTRSAGSSTTGSAACPKPGDQVEVDGLTLTVETTDGRRVGKVLVVRERDEGELRRRRGRPLGRRRRRRSGADRRDDDLLEALAGGRQTTPAASSSASASSR